MKIEIELPKIDGFEFTGEYRKAEPKEWYFSNKGGVDNNPNSLSTSYEYLILKRLQPESLEDRIKAEWPRVFHIDIEPVSWHGVEFWGFKRGEKHWSTFEAKGMKGFKGFLYEFNDKLSIHMDCNYTAENYYHVCRPVAVLFEVMG